MRKYRSFLFDLDNTLWDFDTNACSCITELMQERGLSVYAPDPDAFYTLYKSFNDQLWILYEAGEITQSVLRARRFLESFEAIGIPNAADVSGPFGEAYLERMPSKTALKPHALELLTYLQTRACKMALVTNGFKQVQHYKIRNSGLDAFFGNKVFISEEVGFHKPNPKIFRAAVTAINAKKNETLMVGDNFVNDIEGAQVFGIDQFYYNPHHKPCDGGPTYMSDNLLDVIPLVKQ